MPGENLLAFRMFEDGLVPVEIDVRSEKRGGDFDELLPLAKRADGGIVFGEIRIERDLVCARDPRITFGRESCVYLVLKLFETSAQRSHVRLGKQSLENGEALLLHFFMSIGFDVHDSKVKDT